MARDYLVQIARLASCIQLDESLEDELLKDMRSITKWLNLNPKIDRYVCCPTCYTLYFIEDSPMECGYQELPMTKICNMDLFINSKIGSEPVTS
ncbi:hypothetical protein CROQUDRAFT_656322 [Cronartium quercuum f. sp. fusiforme G11]|uniref:Uncharacterized protein n=1 Tax=Cronartium quercuum f. sp. fusiforme G11 TaxID=708437 RepID=A0A9P6TCC6_9BASI|nr:hypothetical protein CROQUDRAFT_656322 [Cronartium quercuum f. sp. fusiforme G11]